MNTRKLIFALIALTFILSVSYPVAYYSIRTDVTVTVTGKERITKISNGSDQSYYLVYTDAGTFKVEDSILLWNWSSSDVYGKLIQGQSYRIKAVGFRLPFLSEYPNISSYSVPS